MNTSKKQRIAFVVGWVALLIAATLETMASFPYCSFLSTGLWFEIFKYVCIFTSTLIFVDYLVSITKAEALEEKIQATISESIQKSYLDYNQNEVVLKNNKKSKIKEVLSANYNENDEIIYAGNPNCLLGLFEEFKEDLESVKAKFRLYLYISNESDYLNLLTISNMIEVKRNKDAIKKEPYRSFTYRLHNPNNDFPDSQGPQKTNYSLINDMIEHKKLNIKSIHYMYGHSAMSLIFSQSSGNPSQIGENAIFGIPSLYGNLSPSYENIVIKLQKSAAYSFINSVIEARRRMNWIKYIDKNQAWIYFNQIVKPSQERTSRFIKFPEEETNRITGPTLILKYITYCYINLCTYFSDRKTVSQKKAKNDPLVRSVIVFTDNNFEELANFYEYTNWIDTINNESITQSTTEFHLPENSHKRIVIYEDELDQDADFTEYRKKNEERKHLQIVYQKMSQVKSMNSNFVCDYVIFGDYEMVEMRNSSFYQSDLNDRFSGRRTTNKAYIKEKAKEFESIWQNADTIEHGQASPEQLGEE